MLKKLFLNFKQYYIARYFTNIYFFRNGVPPFSHPKNYVKSDRYINGYSEYVASVKEHIQISESSIVQKAEFGDPKITQLNFVNFQPGSVIAIR